MARKKPVWINKDVSITFKSREELWFSYWLEECKLNGVVISWEYEKPTFDLSDSVKFINKVLDRKKSITCDFSIVWDRKYENKVYYNCATTTKTTKGWFIAYNQNCNFHISYVDVKPTNESNVSSSVSFPYKRSWLLSKQGIWIQKVKPLGANKKWQRGDINALFEYTFTPTKLLEWTEEQDRIETLKKDRYLAFVKWKIRKFNIWKKSL